MKKILVAALCILLLSLVNTKGFSQITDKDGITYKTTIVGGRTWTAGNMKVTHFKNGDKIMEAHNEAEWAKANAEQTPAWCNYDYDSKFEKSLAKLYNWYAVTDPRGLAPEGWHIPTEQEWTSLSDSLGGEEVAGLKLKADYGWLVYGTNESGFSATPGGYVDKDGKFHQYPAVGYWWTSTQYKDVGAFYRMLFASEPAIRRNANYKGCGYSVRAIMD